MKQILPKIKWGFNALSPKKRATSLEVKLQVENLLNQIYISSLFKKKMKGLIVTIHKDFNKIYLKTDKIY